MNNTVNVNSTAVAATATAALVIVAVYLAIIVLIIAGYWKVFSKAGKPGWAAIIPIYNLIVLLEVAGTPIWWIVLFLIPIVNFVVLIITVVGVAKNFVCGIGMTLGLIFLPMIFFPILGFGSAQNLGTIAPA